MKEISHKSLHKWKKVNLVFGQLMELTKSEALSELEKYKNIDNSCKIKIKKLIDIAHQEDLFLERAGDELVAKQISKVLNLSGTVLGEYILLSLISNGGMSDIYLAQRKDESIQKKVAIKILPIWKNSKLSLELFNYEQKILSQLRHQNIVTMHHGGVTKDGICFMVMDYLEKATPLDQYVKNNNINLKYLLKIGITVANAISYAHSNLVIHRDLKADNILIDDNSQVFIVDFGIAFLEEDLIKEPLKAYTPDIASPEQILGESITASTDVFSLAATILTLLINKNPLPPINSKGYNINEDKLHIESVISLSKLDRNLKNIFRKALSIKPENRYSTMNEFSNDLNNWLSNKPVMASSYEWAQRLFLFIKRNPAFSASSLMLLISILVFSYKLNESNNLIILENQRTNISLSVLESLIDQANPFDNQIQNLDIKKAIINVIEENKENLSNDPELSYFVFSKLSNIYDQNYLLTEAIESLNIAIESMTKFEQINYPDMFDKWVKLSDLYLLQGEESLSKEAAAKAEIIFERGDIQDPDKLLAFYIQRFKILKIEGVNKKADNELELALNIILSNSKPDTLLIGEAYNTFAHYMLAKKDFDKADKYFLESIKANGNSKYPDRYLPTILTNYAIFLGRDLMDYTKSEEYFLRAINILKGISLQHPKLGTVMSQYAQLLSFTGRIGEGIQALEEAIPLIQQSNNNRVLSFTYNKLARFLSQTNKMVSAYELFVKTLEKKVKFFGINHKTTIDTIELMVAMGLLTQNVDKVFSEIILYLGDEKLPAWLIELQEISQVYSSPNLLDYDVPQTQFEMLNEAIISKIWVNNLIATSQRPSSNNSGMIKSDLFKKYIKNETFCESSLSLDIEPSLLLKEQLFRLFSLCEIDYSPSTKKSIAFISHMNDFVNEKGKLTQYLNY